LNAVPRRAFLLSVIFTIALLSISNLPSQGYQFSENSSPASWSGGLIIDHNCIDLELIPDEWIESAQDDMRIHYAHTSHGGQITTGLSLIEGANSTFASSIGNQVLPTDSGALCILDGNPPHDYITPDLYWQGASALVITQNTLDNNPTLTASLWSWCTQLDSYSEQDVQDYLDAMASLETANPSVIFIYMTGNAQASGSGGYNRWLRNEQIRQYCLDNDKVLFDFADLDCWSDGEHSTYDYVIGEQTLHIPIEHPDFNGDEAAHTTYASCEQKGSAFWWLAAMLAGWNAPDPSTTTTTSSSTTSSTTTTTSQTGSITGPPFLNDMLLYGSIAGILLVVGYALVRRRRI
jgi:hypothetical protein